MSKNKIILTAILAVLIFLLPFSFKNSLVFSEENIQFEDDYTEITEDFEIDGELYIPEGKTVVVKKGVNISMNNAQLEVEGKLVIKGTLVSPVKIENKEGSFGYYIEVISGGELEMMNAEVIGGGINLYPAENKIFSNTALAYSPYMGAVSVKNGKFTGQNINFHDNVIAVSIEGNSSVKVNRSRFSNDVQYEVKRSGTFGTADFRYNWWGNPNGPVKNCDVYNSCWPISGTIDSSDWLINPEFHDPVIIVPGILESWKITDNGEWKMDPILHTFDNLIASFKENGYEEGKDLFVFPYQWRDSNLNNAVLLKEKIQEIKQATDWPKVDIVAHSMGGLLVRQYVESNEYQDDIDQLIMLGTPQWGAPKDYLIWEGGDGFYGAGGFLLEHLVFAQEAHEAGFDKIVDYLHNMPIESVRELLPTYNYLEESDSGELRIYPNNYPKNIFLENLNSSENLVKLNNIEWEIIAGNLENPESTISKIKVKESGTDGLWENGEADEMIYGEGDGTVPKYSEDFDNITKAADELIEINSVHGDLPTKAQCYVIKNLTGKDDCEYVSTFDRIKNVLVFRVFSPIDIQVISPSGQKIGKNFETGEILNEIERAFYTGYDTDNEFITIPNPENGEYKILSQGTNNGEYKIEINKISENEAGEASEIFGEVLGIATPDSREEQIAQLTEEEIITEKPDTAPPVIEISSPENKDYRSDEIISIIFNVTDDDSGVDEEKIKVFLDNEIISKNNIDMAYLEKGEHGLKISAEDKAGNSREEIITFSIDSDINSVIDNIEHYYQDKFITKKAAANFLEVKLRSIKNRLEIYDAIKFSHWPMKHKDKILEILARNINHEIDKLTEEIQTKKSLSQNILQPAKNILVGNLEELKIK